MRPKRRPCWLAGGIDLAVIDFNMPGRNGLELAEEIRGTYPEMPIALATANVQDEIIAKARAINASFVPKPITEEGLRPFLSGRGVEAASNADDISNRSG